MAKWRAIIELVDGQEIEIEEFEAEDREDAYNNALPTYLEVYEIEE